MSIVRILVGLVAAAAVRGLALIEFPDEVLTYWPQLVPAQPSSKRRN